jgi:hypothetical protein
LRKVGRYDGYFAIGHRSEAVFDIPVRIDKADNAPMSEATQFFA